jgi:hypothetical protein
VPPSERPIPQFSAEPPQEPLPYGRWAQTLAEHFERAAETEIGDVLWFPERSWAGRTYVPATAEADEGEVFGYVSYTREHEGAQATDITGVADYTDETAADNPDWTLDLSDHEIGHWRGPQGRRGVITLVWGVSLVANGVVATAELGPSTTDQCELVEDRFTLVSLDAYTGDYVEVRLYGADGSELTRESLYEDGDD